MKTQKLSLCAVMIPVALILTGCGDSTNAQLDPKQSFWTDSAKFESAQIYSIDPKGTIFDKEIEDSFSYLGRSSLLGSTVPKTEDDRQYKLEEIQKIRARLAQLPIPEDLMEEYERDLVATEEHMVQTVDFHQSRDAILEEAFRTRHKAEFEKFEAIKEKVQARNNFVSEANATYEAAKQAERDERKNIDVNAAIFKQKVADYFVANNVLVSVSALGYGYRVSNKDVTDTRYNSKTACESHPRHKTGWQWVWNSDAKVCFEFLLGRSGSGLTSYDFNRLDPKTKAAFLKINAENEKEAIAHAKTLSTFLNAERIAREAKKTTDLLAYNRFGEERSLNRELRDAGLKLSSVTRNAYTNKGELAQPPKGRVIISQRQVLEEIAKEKGFEELPFRSAFSAENAYKVYEVLSEQTTANMVNYEVDKKGRFTVDTDNLPEKMVIQVTTNNDIDMVGSLRLYPDDKGRFIAHNENIKRGGAITDLKNSEHEAFKLHYEPVDNIRTLQMYLENTGRG
ncbi:hypothetical protein AB6D66_26615 [Vibrio pomeroyi]|uniref:Uncharacterized protein n=1 Tax=Vibrio pomeroyi TaxID=198832 RepID=A0ABV4N5F8_9VIBR